MHRVDSQPPLTPPPIPFACCPGRFFRYNLYLKALLVLVSFIAAVVLIAGPYQIIVESALASFVLAVAVVFLSLRDLRKSSCSHVFSASPASQASVVSLMARDPKGAQVGWLTAQADILHIISRAAVAGCTTTPTGSRPQ